MTLGLLIAIWLGVCALVIACGAVAGVVSGLYHGPKARRRRRG